MWNQVVGSVTAGLPFHMLPGCAASTDVCRLRTTCLPCWLLMPKAASPLHPTMCCCSDDQKNPQEWRAAVEGSGMHSRLTVEQRVWPTEWRARTGLLNSETDRWQVIENLTLPLVGHPDGAAWWAQYSKYIYPPTAGNWSTSFLEVRWQHA